MNQILPNRKEAGRRLAKRLVGYINHPQAIVLGLPRGGVPVAYEIAKDLNLPLDVCLVRKLGFPQNPEVAMGAIAEDALIHDYSGNIAIIDQKVANTDKVNREELRAIAAKTKAELRWRARCYRKYRPMLKIGGRIVILVDDGIATGFTMQAAVKILQQHQPKKIIIATPVASVAALQKLESLVDDIVCLNTPKSFYAVGFWYEDFRQITDQEVCDFLAQETCSSLPESC